MKKYRHGLLCITSLKGRHVALGKAVKLLILHLCSLKLLHGKKPGIHNRLEESQIVVALKLQKP